MKRLIMMIVLLMSSSALAENALPSPTPETVAAEGEAVDVSKVTEKYWAQGKDSELGVVQNRKYTSENRFELDLLTGSISTDPFLSVHQYGGSLGYHFSQYFSLHAIAWKASVNNSDAYTSFKAQTSNAAIDLNRPKGFYGLQANENILYGKASLFGKMIIYVDIFVLGGMGITDTDSGKNLTPFVGLGQKIHLNQTMTLHLDYRVMKFNETIPSSTGGVSHERSNTTDAISFGIGFLY